MIWLQALSCQDPNSVEVLAPVGLWPGVPGCGTASGAGGGGGFVAGGLPVPRLVAGPFADGVVSSGPEALSIIAPVVALS